MTASGLFPPLSGAKDCNSKMKPARPPMSYANLFKNSRKIKNAEKLTFHADVCKGKLKITNEDFACAEWSATLIGVVTGAVLPYNVVKRFVEANRSITTPRVLVKDNRILSLSS